MLFVQHVVVFGAALDSSLLGSIGTSCAALTFFTSMTCVTISSDVLLTRSGRSTEGICRATRGSMMKFFPVAALTASATCVRSASLKFGVMGCAAS
jgi:hypothetical protein